MKKLLLIITTFILTITPSFGFDFKKLITEDFKYNLHSGVGQVNIAEDNDFESELDFTYVNFGGGLSYKLNETYTLGAVMSFKKFVKLDYTQTNQSGSTTNLTTYSDLMFSISRKWKDFIITAGYDNLNYFIGAKQDVIEPVRVDRASAKASWLKFKESNFIPSVKLGLFIPVSDDVSGFDINLSGKYIITKDKKLSVDAYLYKALLTANSNDSSATAYGVLVGYSFN